MEVGEEEVISKKRRRLDSSSESFSPMNSNLNPESSVFTSNVRNKRPKKKGAKDAKDVGILLNKKNLPERE